MPQFEAFAAGAATSTPGPEGGSDGFAAPAIVDSAGLLQGAREILIRHGGVCYRLRHTRNDKLILTK